MRNDDKNTPQNIDNQQREEATEKTRLSRRDLMKAGGIAAAAGAAGTLPLAAAGSEDTSRRRITVFPKYFPRAGFTPEIDVAGKFAVITGASRGIGRATAEELVARGVTVIGTSRDVANVPIPPTSFDLLDLDITSDASVANFVNALLAHPDFPGQVDILINNAGRYVLGTITPPPIASDPVGFFLEQSKLGMETLYEGHVRVTLNLLPLMPQVGYSRLMFTGSSVSGTVGGSAAEAAVGDGFTNFQNVYTSGKRALLSYANSLRGLLRAAGSQIKVSTVNPYTINTGLGDTLNPIFTEPVDGDGNAPFNPDFQGFLDAVRFALINGLPASFVGRAYWQLLAAEDPLPNVVVGSTREPYATMSGAELINSLYLGENKEAAIRFGCALPPS
ncbi:MAG: SDR family NAD(P)-dependent oxidoreductase [Pseudomonadota bacterium]